MASTFCFKPCTLSNNVLLSSSFASVAMVVVSLVKSGTVLLLLLSIFASSTLSSQRNRLKFMRREWCFCFSNFVDVFWCVVPRSAVATAIVSQRPRFTSNNFFRNSIQYENHVQNHGGFGCFSKVGWRSPVFLALFSFSVVDDSKIRRLIDVITEIFCVFAWNCRII